MKKLTMSFWKRLGLVAVILAAGFCYSCGQQGEPVPLMADGGTVLAEAAVPESADEPAKAVQSEAERTADASTAAASETAAGSADAAHVDICFVHVCGEVNTPGVYELEAGQRICDAIERAGGFTESAAADYLNLAEPVRDGMKLTVPKQSDIPKPEWAPERVGYGTTGTAGDRNPAAGEHAGTGLIDLNTATKEELMTLPGIGEARAEDMIRYREEHGGFGKIEDVMKISGIKDAAFQKIKDYITVSP